MARTPKAKVAKKKSSKIGRYANKPVPVAKAQPPIGDPFRATVKFNEQVFEATGATAIEAFKKIGQDVPKNFMLKTKAWITLEVDGMRAEHILFAMQFKRFLFNKTATEIWSKRISLKLQRVA